MVTICGLQTAVREAGPVLELVLAAEAERRWSSLKSAPAAACEHVVGEVGLAEGVVEVAAADHAFDVRDQRAVGAEVAAADLVGALVALVAGGVVDLVELGLDAEMGAEVEVGVGGDALEGVGRIVGVAEGVADADLDVCQARRQLERPGRRAREAPRRNEEQTIVRSRGTLRCRRVETTTRAIISLSLDVAR